MPYVVGVIFAMGVFLNDYVSLCFWKERACVADQVSAFGLADLDALMLLIVRGLCDFYIDA